MISTELKSVISDLLIHKKKLAVVAIAGIIMALCKGYLPLFIQQMVSYSNSTEKLFSIAWIGLAVAFVMTSSRYLHIYTMNVISENVSQSLREKLQRKFIHLDLKFHNKYISGSGGLLSRTFNDVKVIHDGLRLFADLFSAPLTFIFLIGMLCYYDWKLTCYIFILVPVLLLILGRIKPAGVSFIQGG